MPIIQKMPQFQCDPCATLGSHTSDSFGSPAYCLLGLRLVVTRHGLEP